ncbi:hypothetical protein [Nannocystis pusilla]|uniref:hypothetical protein n=1 Tax=Nannocystis pusilla TaxID=889268 RepID=UPI003DA2CBC2
MPVAAGTYDLSVLSGPQGSEISSTAPGSLEIAARDPVALVEGTEEVGTIAEPLETKLYTFVPPPEPKKVTFSIASADAEASARAIALPASGSFADLIKFDSEISVYTSSEDPLYLVYWDNSGYVDYDYTINVTVADPPPPEIEPNNDCLQANELTLPSATLASFPDQTNVDWFKFTATDADIGKTIHVITAPGDDTTDTVVEVFEADCTTSLGGPSSDDDYHEDFVSDAIPAAGEYFVKVSYSDFGYSTPNYELLIAIE